MAYGRKEGMLKKLKTPPQVAVKGIDTGRILYGDPYIQTVIAIDIPLYIFSHFIITKCSFHGHEV